MTREINDDTYPASAVAFIRAWWGYESYTGSGVLVGQNDVLTASHVIYDASLGGLADNIQVYFSYDPDDSDVSDYYEAFPNYYFTDFNPSGGSQLERGDNISGTLSGAEKDIALLSINSSAGFSYGWYGIDYFYTSGNVSVTGHPGIHNLNMVIDTDYAFRDNIDNYVNTLSLDINGGQSGGPIWHGSANSPYVVGVVSTGEAAASVTAHQSALNSNISANDSFILAPREGIFRFFNPETGSHYFAPGTAQRDTIAGNNPSWINEGMAFEAATVDTSALSAVVRLYNPISQRHLFTSNEAEINIVQAQGFIEQSEAWYVSNNINSLLGYDTPVYRIYNQQLNSHVYSSNQAEIDILQAQPGAINEGIAYWVI